ncbi:MAG: hypothetical protein H0W40_08985 [Methylibium sp.]|uniref:hypothetical protein n=1 Tax=Methylibium sp. TaxID=2067992 RepID=UPI0017935113|nr:hypothetical protein [Methylibium sp.]MBA3597500.1 hypothetical protein [Methylibium sp.]
MFSLLQAVIVPQYGQLVRLPDIAADSNDSSEVMKIGDGNHFPQLGLRQRTSTVRLVAMRPPAAFEPQV